MKKFIIIFSLGISMLVVGGIVFASELSQFTPYDIITNERDLPVIRKTDVYDISDIEGPIYFSSGYFQGNYHGYNSNIFDTEQIVIYEDDNQSEGTITIDLAYISDVGLNNCRVDFDNTDDDYYRENRIKNKDGKHGMMSKGEHRGRRLSSDYGVDRKRAVLGSLDCEHYYSMSGFNVMKHDNFKYFMREKKLPTMLCKMTVVINPKDAHKFR